MRANNIARKIVSMLSRCSLGDMAAQTNMKKRIRKDLRICRVMVAVWTRARAAALSEKLSATARWTKSVVARRPTRPNLITAGIDSVIANNPSTK
jgi:hypothetical protein